ncbi:heparin lyase I family protein [Motilimonas pumila]|uniref:Rhamnogalacturonase A/B/Epimerase-like pectate lyase domain-containing protein n=1 Tax=Motilimonas pumila TaxID=2303987 RepID=A0A418YKX2_9GAMM|nr:heparin lyase I family protein [Motilimonas pumila]RJG51626.1 hypothetical protein D1Z90_02545 [Motilimonas pumila]
MIKSMRFAFILIAFISGCNDSDSNNEVAIPDPSSPVIDELPAPAPARPVLAEGVPEHNVKALSFGLIPDDQKDDTAAMLELLAGVSEGDIVYFPPGEYHFEQEIIFDSSFPENVTLVGSDKTFISKRIVPEEQQFNGIALWRLQGVKKMSIVNFRFRNQMQSAESLNEYDDGISVFGSTNINIRRNDFYGFKNACLRVTSSIDGVLASEDVHVYRNNFYNCTSVTTHNESDQGITVEDIEFSENTFNNMEVGLDVISHGLARGVKIVKNSFFDGKYEGIKLSGFDNILIKYNYFKDITGYSVHILPFTFTSEERISSYIIRNNVMHNNRYGIRLKPFDQNLVPNPISNPIFNFEIVDNYFEGIYHSSADNPDPTFFQVIRVNPYTREMINNLTLLNNTYFRIAEEKGGIFYDQEMIDDTVINQHFSGQRNMQKDLSSLPFEVITKKPEFKSKPAILRAIDWDYYFPFPHEYEVAYPEEVEYSISKITSPGYSRNGKASAAFELVDINDPLVNGSYRVEIKDDVVKEDNAIRWYAFSIRLSGDWNYSDGEESLFQVHTAPNDGNWERKISVPYALTTISGNFRFFVSGSNETPIPLVNKTYFPLGEYERNKWIDWIVYVKHDSVNGELKVWKDGEQVVDYEGAVGYAVDSTNHWTYPKWGIYRWSWAEYPHIESRKVFIDKIKVGSEEASLEIMKH